MAATYFMENLDTTIIATALPQMARSFHVGPNEVSLGMTAYMLTLAVLIPISGWIADRYGARTVFGGAVVIFTIASVLCGSADSVLFFTAARVLQGAGGAMMVPVGRMIVARNTDQTHMMRAISTITWPAIIAPVLGPTVGGLITTYASWHWIFFLNVPFSIAAFAAIVIFVPNESARDPKRLDVPGLVMTSTSLVSLVFGMELASRTDVSLFLAGGFISSGIAVGLFAIRHLRETPHPILNLSVFGVRTYTASVWWGGFARAGIEAVPYLCPLLFQIGFGLSAFHSGLLLLVSAIGNLGMKALTTPIVRRFGFRAVAIANGTAVALTILAFASLAPSTGGPALFLVLFLYGVTRSLQLSTMTALSYADVREELKSSASTVWSTMQQMTTALGIAFGAVCLRFASVLRAGGHLAADHRFTVPDFRWAFVFTALLTLAPTIAYWRLPAEAGDNLAHG
ncbi:MULTISPECIES: MFS transporter [unclassified Novosphingobium]|uniref:MFS transporter n=1 Tax=unclassified Novosphingobium TaxID=2644732 RepID=UPI00179BFBAB|nr:EmrB/QacA subfamily drug resistance transporter [Novosphingobium sp. BK256]MBB3373391.1 EmrB/QacA subfamily drug resistance transporter [Novosphingobium sp. BK280]MBB3377760.1 EmrB/QacA subfamily drug resistance transporter [Novosphingobium sp. BK258]MBB3418829.1 EmrB/QacA subfamily drug resistance transporter [Novosphingobium sp. BK267]MBB3450336.1 EmrB/QacA subfamily drug resistance transporter [Novosphingobium sp. BK352]MBB3499311.1 EmrB/QacA subfamily drug resistance transporter [Novosp